MKVAVVIATFGDQKWQDLALRRAWPSAKSQDPNHLKHLHEHLGPISRVRNEAAARVPEENKWLCFVDGDDELAPGYLDAMRATAEPATHALSEWLAGGDEELAPVLDARPRLLVPSVQYVHPDGHEEQPRIPNEGQWPEVNTCVIGTLIPRALFEQVGGFREGYEPYEDYELFLRCWRAGARLVEVRSAVYRAFVYPQSAHRNSAGIKHRRDLHKRILAEHRAALRSVPPEV